MGQGDIVDQERITHYILKGFTERQAREQVARLNFIQKIVRGQKKDQTKRKDQAK